MLLLLLLLLHAPQPQHRVHKSLVVLRPPGFLDFARRAFLPTSVPNMRTMGLVGWGCSADQPPALTFQFFCSTYPSGLLMNLRKRGHPSHLALCVCVLRSLLILRSCVVSCQRPPTRRRRAAQGSRGPLTDLLWLLVPSGPTRVWGPSRLHCEAAVTSGAAGGPGWLGARLDCPGRVRRIGDRQRTAICNCVSHSVITGQASVEQTRWIMFQRCMLSKTKICTRLAKRRGPSSSYSQLPRSLHTARRQ